MFLIVGYCWALLNSLNWTDSFERVTDIGRSQISPVSNTENVQFSSQDNTPSALLRSRLAMTNRLYKQFSTRCYSTRRCFR